MSGKSNLNPLTDKPYSDNYYKITKQLSSLPANDPKVVKELKQTILDNDFIIIKAETGAGKSVSVVPNILKFHDFKKKIICTQPRSLNTETAKFVAQILDDPQGKYINFAYRGNVNLTDDTILSYETDGRVVNYFYNDPTFDFADILVIDEVHEKNPYIEFLLLFMKRVLKAQNKSQPSKSKSRSKSRSKSKSRSNQLKPKRKKLVIMSATLDIDYYKNYFRGIPTGVVEIPGRAYPVKSIFLKDQIEIDRDQYLDKAQEIIVDIVNNQRQPGDILVFIPAIAQIVKGCRKLNQELQQKLRDRIICLTLYRGITEDQKRLIQDADAYKSLPDRPQRKIVFSTNIAESGVTIDGIKFVIDTGLAYDKTFDAAQRMNVLRKEYISKFAIEQRKGRAGRTAPGTCYHLYTENQYQFFPLSQPSEMRTINLDMLIMDLMKSPLASNAEDVADFFDDLIEPPSRLQLFSTFKYFKELKIITQETGELTTLGKCLHHLGLDVGIGLALLVCDYFNVVWPTIRVASMLSIESNISKWFRMPPRNEEKKFKKIINSYQGSWTDLQMFHTLSQEYRNTKDRQQWAKNRYLNLHMFKKADREAQRIYQRYKTIPDECKIEPNIKPANDQNKNLVYTFLHGYYNQVLVEAGQNEYRNLNGVFVKIRPGRYNSLSKLKETIVYMELADIMGRIQANGLINVTDPETLQEIAPHFEPLDRI